MPRFVILLFCVFSITTGEFVVVGVLPDVANDFAITIGTAGLLVTAYAVGMIVGGPVLTALTTTVGRQRLMVALLAVAVAGNAASALAPNFSSLLVARLITALVTSTFFAQAVVVAVQSAPPDRAATTVARLAFGMNLAMILGAPIGTAIGAEWGWRATFAAVSIACMVGLFLVYGGLNLPAEEARGTATSELRVLRKWPVLLALAIIAIGNLGVLMVFSYFAPLLTDLGGNPSSHVPALLLAYGVGATVGNLIGGSLYDRNSRLYQPTLLGLLALVMVTAHFTALDAIPSVVMMVAIGALGFAILPGMQTMVMTTAAEAPTLAMAVSASGYQVAAGAAGLFGGLIADSEAGLRPIYLTAAAATCCGLLLTIASRRRAAVLTTLDDAADRIG